MNGLHTWKLWVFLTASSALFGWLLMPEPTPSAVLIKPRRDEWRLAALPRRFDQTSLAGLILSAPYWGAPDASTAVAAAPPPPDPRWRIAAVFGRGREAGVLILHSAPDKPPERLRVGEALPSGHRIVSIGERDVCVRIDKKTYRLGVERRDE